MRTQTKTEYKVNILHMSTVSKGFLFIKAVWNAHKVIVIILLISILSMIACQEDFNNKVVHITFYILSRVLPHVTSVAVE